MKTLGKSALFLLPLAVAASPATAKGIERHVPQGEGPHAILDSVEVPAGSRMLYLSGQIASPIDPTVPLTASVTLEQLGDTKAQTVSALNKIKASLAARGYSLSDVVKLTVYLAADPKIGGMDFTGMNNGFAQFFGTRDNPNTVVRSTVQVAALVAPPFLVEIEATAAKTP